VINTQIIFFTVRVLRLTFEDTINCTMVATVFIGRPRDQYMR